jgi:hypothetical protein
MGETIDAIQDKLSFSNISDQVSEHVSNAVETAKDAVYDATVGKAVYFMKNIGNEISDSTLVQTAKNNPFPFVLIGLGAGLLAYQSMSGGRSRKSRYLSEERTSRDLTSLEETKAGRFAGERPGMMDKVTNVAGSAYETVTGAVDTAYSSAGEYASQAYEKAGQMRVKAASTYDHYLQEQPLALGAVALALGAAVGMAIPPTQYESELVGEKRDELLQKAQETASELLDKTKGIVSDAGQALKEQAR